MIKKIRFAVPQGIDTAVAATFRSVEQLLDGLVEQINAELFSVATDTTPGLIELSVQSELEAATNVTTAVVPGRLHYHPGVAKFWACVNVSAGTHSLAASYNVTSITDGATGIFTLTIGTDFSDTNWCCIVTAEGGGTGPSNARVATVSSQAVGSVVISTYDLAATPSLQDSISIFVAGFGDHA